MKTILKISRKTKLLEIFKKNKNVSDDVVDQVEEITNKPLLVGQIQALGDIISGFQAGTYTYNQAKNMLMIGVGLTEEQAKKLLDKQDDEEQDEGDNDDGT